MPDRVDNDHSHDRAKALSELQQLLLDTPDITGFLDELARYAADTIGCGLSCGITMDRDAGPLTVARSDAHARTRARSGSNTAESVLARTTARRRWCRGGCLLR